MIDPNVYLTLAVSALAGLAMIVAAGLAGWRGWLSLKRWELDHYSENGTANFANGMAGNPFGAPAGARIEIADLKERIKKLEAIAAGVDL